MKSLKVVAITGALIAVFALAGCQSHTSTSTSVEVTTSTESGTKTYTSSSETKDGVTTSTETTVETPANAEDDFYNIEYHVQDDGTVTVSGQYSAEKWWKVLGNNENTAVVKDGVEDGNKYVANVRSTIDNGQVQVILGHAVAGQDTPVDYCVLTFDVEGGKILGIDDTKSTVVQDLSTVFGEVEVN